MESFADLFPLVLDHCKGKISDVAFNLWLKDIVPVRLVEFDRLFKGKLRVQDEHRQGEVHRHPPDRLRGGPRL